MSDNQTTVTAPRRDAALDGLRGLAALMVFVFHYGGGLKSNNAFIHLLGYLSQMGWTGLVLFFALSGFLITGSLWDSINERNLLRNFFMRRALRILPLYFFALLLSFLFALRHMDGHTLRSFLIYAFFLQDIPTLASRALINASPLPLIHLWTLAVEEHFYLLWPFLLLYSDNRRSARNLCLRIFVGAEIFRLIVCLPAFTSVRGPYFDSFFITHAGALALGAAIALALRSRDRTNTRIAAPVRFVRRWAVLAFFLGVALYIVCGIYAHSFNLDPQSMAAPIPLPNVKLPPQQMALHQQPLEMMFGLMGISIAAAALIPIALRSGLPRRLFSLAPLAAFGRLSYGFYVFHLLLEPVFDFLGRVLTHATVGGAYQAVRMAVAFPITLGVAWISFRFLEMPFLRIARRYPLNPPLPRGMGLSQESSRISQETRAREPEAEKVWVDPLHRR